MATPLEALVKVLRPLVATDKYLIHMLKQSTPFPLIGMEHIFVTSENPQYCQYCGYPLDNFNHVTKDN